MAFSNIEEVSDRHLHILWTNADPETSENMVMMYARNAMLNEWWAPRKLDMSPLLLYEISSQGREEARTCRRIRHWSQPLRSLPR